MDYGCYRLVRVVQGSWVVGEGEFGGVSAAGDESCSLVEDGFFRMAYYEAFLIYALCHP